MRRMEHRHSSPQAADAFRSATTALAEELADGDNNLFQRFISLTK